MVGLKIDPQDEYLLKLRTWYVHKTRGYVESTFNGQTVKLHRCITGAKTGQVVDHINGDKLDNRRCNLRICTQAQNCRNNRNVRKNKTSLYKGVSKYWNKWKAQIQVDKKKTHIGYYPTQEDAARAYDEKALELHGEFAYLNFPRRTMLDLVKDEMERNLKRWGEQNHADGTCPKAYYRKLTDCRYFNQEAVKDNRLTWKLILEEEVLEAFCETDPQRLQDELIQVAAVALQWAEAIKRRKESGAV